MITTTIIFGVTFFLALMVSWNLASPIFFAQEDTSSASRRWDDGQSSPLLLDRERLFLALEELESDYRGGKLTTQDYGDEKEALVTQLASVMKSLEGAS